MLLSEIANHVKGVLSGGDQPIVSVSIDTRTLEKGDLYIAIKGENYDGHCFIDEAKIAGASAVLVEKMSITTLPQIVVKESHLALAQLAGAWKNKADVKTIAITGSNGKTTVKEMIASILAVESNVLYTQGNLNNDIGVPLTLLKLNKQHQVAVIEVGANHAGEIAYSCGYVRPDVAIINNAGSAHIEGFGSIKGVAKAKGEIIQSLSSGGIAVLNKDDDFFGFWKKIAAGRKWVTFGLNQSADYRAKMIHLEVKNKLFKTRFKLLTENDEIDIQLNLAGQHNVINALAATACVMQLGVGLQQVKQGLELIMPVTGRLQPRIGKHGGLIIDDSYNANPDSIKAALAVLIESGGEPWMVLGALAEMGSQAHEIHKELAELIKSMGVIRLLTIGPDAKTSASIFGKGATFFSSQDHLIHFLKKELKGGESVLIKGSRAQKMEKIVMQLVIDLRK